MLSRWFFRWGQDERDFSRISNSPICGALGVQNVGSGVETGAFLIVIPRTTIIIGFNPPFWKYNRQSWYRSAVRVIAHQVVGFEPEKPISTPTLMIWSNDEFMLPTEPERATGVRALTHALVTFQSEIVWGWMCHVVTQPIARQRSKTLHKEFEQWELETRASRKLPSNRQVH